MNHTLACAWQAKPTYSQDNRTNTATQQHQNHARANNDRHREQETQLLLPFSCQPCKLPTDQTNHFPQPCLAPKVGFQTLNSHPTLVRSCCHVESSGGLPRGKLQVLNSLQHSQKKPPRCSPRALHTEANSPLCRWQSSDGFASRGKALAQRVYTTTPRHFSTRYTPPRTRNTHSKNQRQTNCPLTGIRTRCGEGGGANTSRGDVSETTTSKKSKR